LVIDLEGGPFPKMKRGGKGGLVRGENRSLTRIPARSSGKRGRRIIGFDKERGFAWGVALRKCRGGRGECSEDQGLAYLIQGMSSLEGSKKKGKRGGPLEKRGEDFSGKRSGSAD